MKCTYVFKKGIKKNSICDINNCSKHNVIVDVPDTINIELHNLKNRILNIDTSIDNRNIIMKHYYNLKKLDTNTSEYNKNLFYIEQSLSIPWNTYYKISDNIDMPINLFLQKIKTDFDKSIYGMENVKNEIINYICKFITNPQSQKNNIALYGSAGVCKTRFIQVLSKILNLPLKIISLGGMKDSSFLLGHHETYINSTCGIITQSIIDSKIMNPILYFDELDKVSNNGNSQDIYSVLSNITDSTINTHFKDHFFSNLELDLSKVFYIFTFNDINCINKILLDRLNIIYVNTPSKKDQLIILKDYCLNDIIKNIGITKNIQFDDKCYNKIIEYINIDPLVSSGIREACRILEKIILEINKELLINKYVFNDNFIDEKNDGNLFIDITSFNIYFEKLKTQFIYMENNISNSHMYM